jgi:hypothetical protein
MKLHIVPLAVMLIAAPVLARAQVNGGSPSVRNGAGFSCAPGTAWINDGGVARCQTPTAAAPFLASCPPLSNFQPSGACQFDIPATGAGVTVTAPTKTTTHIGQTTLTCNAGVWGAAVTSCTPIPTLAVSPGPGTVYQGFDYTFSWSSSFAASVTWSCSGANPSSGSLAASGSQALTTPNVGTTNCQVEATGPGGSSGVRTFNFYTDTRPGCPNTSYRAGACTYDISARLDGASGSFGTTTPGYSGAISASCSLGAWTFGASSCAPVPPTNCSHQTLTGSGCSFSFGAVASGSSATVSTSTAGYSGTATASCSSGVLSLASAPTCVPAAPMDCPAATRAAGACSFSFSALSNGASATVGTSTPGYTGSATASCSSGVLSMTGNSCNPSLPADCPAQSLSAGGCTFNFGSVANGAASTVSTSTSGYSGSATATCSAGALSLTGSSCSPTAPTGCAAATLSSGACSYTFGPIANGGASTVGTSTPGYAGSATASCSGGALSLLAPSCNAAQPSPSPCSASSTSFSACSFSVASLASGASELVTTTTPGYTGNITATCNSGSLTWGGASCNPMPPLCAGGQSWNGSACACPGGTTWNGSNCVAAPPPGSCPAGMQFELRMISAEWPRYSVWAVYQDGFINYPSVTAGMQDPLPGLAYGGTTATGWITLNQSIANGGMSDGGSPAAVPVTVFSSLPATGGWTTDARYWISAMGCSNGRISWVSFYGYSESGS